MFKTHRHWLGICLICTGLLAAGGTHAGNSLRIGWVYAMANAPAIIAKERGFFREQGVSVELHQFNSGPLIIRALQAGDLDMAYIGVPPVYRAIEKGLDIKIVSKVNYGQAALIVGQDSPINTLADLRGKRIGSVRRGSGMDIFLRGLILADKAGLDPERDVTIVEMPAKMMEQELAKAMFAVGSLEAKMMEASVHRKVVDAAFTWEPFVSLAELGDHDRVLVDMNELFPRYPWYVLVATTRTRTRERALMQKVLQANQQAIEYLNHHRDASNLILIRTFNLRELASASGSKVTASAIINNARRRLGWEQQFTQSDKQFLQSLMKHAYDRGQGKRQVHIETLFDTKVN